MTSLSPSKEAVTSKRIRLTDKVGNALAGTIFIQGLHGVPKSKIWKDRPADFFYWEEGTTPEDNAFLWETVLWGTNPDGTKYSYAEVLGVNK